MHIVKGYSSIEILYEGRKHLILKAKKDENGKIVTLKTTSDLTGTS